MWQKMLQVGSGSGGGPSIEPFTVIIHLDSNFEGQPVTLSQDGQTPMIKLCPTTAPYDVIFHPLKDGVWDISTTTIDGTPVTGKTDPLLEWTTYEYTLQSGFNFTEWLTRGRVTETFSSLDDVLADETTIRQLMTVHDSVEYLRDGLEADADSADTILNNKNCQKWINISPYALDTLQSNATVKALMDSIGLYGYGELIEDGGVMKPKGLVPKMTANNAPYGEAGGTNKRTDDSRYDYYSAFIKITSYQYESSGPSGRVYYKFPCPVCVKMADFTITGARIQNIKIIASNDGINWTPTPLKTVNGASGANNGVKFENNDYYLYYGFDTTCTNGGSSSLTVCQFYGRTLSVSVPKMSTDNHTPYGEAIENYNRGGNPSSQGPAWMAFDGNPNTHAHSDNSNGDKGIGYKFTHPVIIKMVGVTNQQTGSRGYNGYIQGSNDNGNTWENIQAINTQGVGQTDYVCFPINNDTEYMCYRLFEAGAVGYKVIATLQFYGLDYSEKEFGEDSKVKYIYDHGVELRTVTIPNITATYGSAKKNSDSIEVSSTNTSIPSSSTAEYFPQVAFSDVENMENYNLVRISLGHILKTNGTRWGIFAFPNAIPRKRSDGAVSSKEITNINDNYVEIPLNYQNEGLIIMNSGDTATITVTEVWIERS